MSLAGRRRAADVRQSTTKGLAAVVTVMIVAIASRSGAGRGGAEKCNLRLVSSDATIVGRTLVVNMMWRPWQMLLASTAVIGPEGVVHLPPAPYEKRKSQG